MYALSIFFATSAAFCFGCSMVITRQGLKYLDSQTGSMISIGTTVLFYLISAPFWMRARDWFSPGVWVFVGLGVLHPLLSQFLSFEANRRMGPTLSATLSATAPFFATTTAILFLAESPTVVVGLGTFLSVVGIMVLSWNRQGDAKGVKAGLLFATGAAVIRGLNYTLSRFGLKLMPNPFMAAFVAFTVSLLGSLLFYRMRKGFLPKPARIHRTGTYFFAVNGLFVTFGIWFVYSALSVGHVSVTSPIISGFPMFTMLISVIFRQEKMTRKIVTGVCTVLTGVVMIGIGTEH